MNKSGFLILGIVCLVLYGCGTGTQYRTDKGKEIKFRYASNISMTEHDGFTVVELRNPWDTLKTLQKLILVEKDKELPEGYGDAVELRIPLDNTVVYSSVHNSLIAELGSEEAISGVCDTKYITDDNIKKGLEDGRISDCGNSMSPNIEKIISLQPEAVLLSPYENGGGEGKLKRFGLNLVECADYMEPTPLGRAEWMRFYGKLYGKEREADSLFKTVEREYLELKNMASLTKTKPSVIFDRVYGQSWSVPGKRSTIGILLNDAGGKNPFDNLDVAGSVQLSPEKVLFEAGDADIWIIRFAGSPINMEDLKRDKPIYSQIKAYQDKKVYGSETIGSNLFDDQAFHPHWVLKDLIRTIHPETSIEDGKHYFEKLK